MNKPKQIPREKMNFDELISQCQWYLDEVAQGNGDDFDQEYIFEAAIEAVFGEEVWQYINAKMK